MQQKVVMKGRELKEALKANCKSMEDFKRFQDGTRPTVELPNGSLMKSDAFRRFLQIQEGIADADSNHRRA